MRRFRTKTLEIRHAERSVLLVQRLQLNVGQVLSKPSTTTWNKLAALANLFEKLVKRTLISVETATWNLAITAIRLAVRDHECSIAAHNRSDDVVTLRESATVLTKEFRSLVSAMAPMPAQVTFASAFDESAQLMNRTQLLKGLELLPLPTLYWSEKVEKFPIQRPVTHGEERRPEPSVVKVIGFFDQLPLCSPQLLRPAAIYSLRFRVRGENWPDDADAMRLDLLTTCPRELFSASTFTLTRPSTLNKYEGELHGQISFPISQSLISPDLVFRVRCAFVTQSREFKPVPVIGHTELSFRVADPEKSLLKSGYKRLDLHVSELLRNLLESSPRIQSELANLVPMLEALVALLGVYAQSGVLKGAAKITENEFRKQVVRDLRFQLGEDVQEHCEQAGGQVDIRFRGVVVELKVEDSTGDRAKIAGKYSSQLSQYEGVEARQTGIVLVLDVTEKELSPGDIRNDVLLIDVPTHGGDDTTKPYPSKAFVFVVNGNTRNPSSYKKPIKRKDTSKV